MNKFIIILRVDEVKLRTLSKVKGIHGKSLETLLREEIQFSMGNVVNIINIKGIN